MRKLWLKNKKETNLLNLLNLDCSLLLKGIYLETPRIHRRVL